MKRIAIVACLLVALALVSGAGYLSDDEFKMVEDQFAALGSPDAGDPNFMQRYYQVWFSLSEDMRTTLQSGLDINYLNARLPIYSAAKNAVELQPRRGFDLSGLISESMNYIEEEE